MSPGSKVKVIPVTFKQLLLSDGTTTPRYIELDIKEPTGWGPHLEQIQAHTKTESRTGTHRWNLVFWYSMDGKDWEGPYDLFAAVSSNNNTIQTAYTTRTTLGMKLKFALAVWQGTAGSPDSAVVSAALAFQFLT